MKLAFEPSLGRAARPLNSALLSLLLPLCCTRPPAPPARPPSPILASCDSITIRRPKKSPTTKFLPLLAAWTPIYLLPGPHRLSLHAPSIRWLRRPRLPKLGSLASTPFPTSPHDSPVGTSLTLSFRSSLRPHSSQYDNARSTSVPLSSAMLFVFRPLGFSSAPRSRTYPQLPSRACRYQNTGRHRHTYLRRTQAHSPPRF